MLPPFTADGVLPPGDYALTVHQLRLSHLVTGAGSSSEHWDATWRQHLVDNLEVLARQLWQVEIDRIFVDGSFVENKDHPQDIDGYFECAASRFVTGQLERELNALNPFQSWTWSHSRRRPTSATAPLQLPLWHQYRVELYPHFTGLLTGLRDRFGHDLEFLAAFRLSRQGQPKGIIQILEQPDQETP